MSKDERNRRLHKLLGHHWHEFKMDVGGVLVCSCGERFSIDYNFLTHLEMKNLDYSDPRLVVMSMRQRDDWAEFRDSVGGWKTPHEVIRIDLMLDRTGKMADVAIGWLERKAARAFLRLVRERRREEA